jgi:hypothetical protein
MIGDIDPNVKRVVRILREHFGESIYINFGQSDNYLDGFNNGYDDGEAGFPTRKGDAPVYEPFRSSYERGYEEGWDMFREQQEATHDHD